MPTPNFPPCPPCNTSSSGPPTATAASSNTSASPLRAIRKFCSDQCQAGQPYEVKDCEGDKAACTPCPLFAFRLERKPSGQSSLKAIRLQCRQCFQDDFTGIKECKDTACPLWSYREGKNPHYSEATREHRRQQAFVMQASRKQREVPASTASVLHD